MWTVVVVDDEKNFCTLLSEYIHALAPRFQVAACFQDGRAAWNFLRNHNVDLVISDVRMPHMSGLDLAQRLFADDRSIPVVLISGYSEFEYAKQAIQYGVVNYLLKPVDFEELRETLDLLHFQGRIIRLIGELLRVFQERQQGLDGFLRAQAQENRHHGEEHEQRAGKRGQRAPLHGQTLRVLRQMRDGDKIELVLRGIDLGIDIRRIAAHQAGESVFLQRKSAQFRHGFQRFQQVPRSRCR